MWHGRLIVGGFLFALMVGNVTQHCQEGRAQARRERAVRTELRSLWESPWAFSARAERPAFSAKATR
jgi:hypothetical protein